MIVYAFLFRYFMHFSRHQRQQIQHFRQHWAHGLSLPLHLTTHNHNAYSSRVYNSRNSSNGISHSAETYKVLLSWFTLQYPTNITIRSRHLLQWMTNFQQMWQKCLLFLDVHQNEAWNLDQSDDQRSKSNRTKMMKGKYADGLTDHTRQTLLISVAHNTNSSPKHSCFSKTVFVYSIQFPELY